MQKTAIRLSGRLALSVLTLPVSLLGQIPAFAPGFDPSSRIAVVAPSQETETQREARLIEEAKKEGKIVIWDAGAAKEWEQRVQQVPPEIPVCGGRALERR